MTYKEDHWTSLEAAGLQQMGTRLETDSGVNTLRICEAIFS